MKRTKLTKPQRTALYALYKRSLHSIKHTNLSMYLKARHLGWRTLWTGEGMICMRKDKR